MVISGHIVEKEMFLDQFVGCLFIGEVFMARRQTIIVACNTESFEDIEHCLFESESFFFSHSWWQVPASNVSADSGSH